jgi:lysophospholipase L1-like esterase
MATFRFSSTALAAISLVSLAACSNESLMPATATAGDRFARYVSIGNSITAGYQSAGINDSTQRQSYAALIAAQMGTTFNLPLLNKPGCPPPYTNVFTQARLGGTSAPPCALREAPFPEFINNVAVPGAAVQDVLTNLGTGSAANTLTSLILGGRTQLQAAQAVHPTFLSVWIGNNDALGAAVTGDASLATPSNTFTTRYQNMADSIAAMQPQGAVLVSVVNVTNIPYLSPGAAYFAAKLAGGLPATFTVSPNCAPTANGGVGDQMLVPFGYGFGVLLAQATNGIPVTLDCVNDTPVGGYSILTTGEVITLASAVLGYNTAISGRAQAKGWAYVDLNPTLDSLKLVGEVPLFPNAPPNPLYLSQPFGKWFSLDGVHPSALAHKLIANKIIAGINAKYGSTIPVVP